MHPILFQFKLPFSIPVVGDIITIYMYGFMIAIGFLMGYLLAYYRFSKTEFDNEIAADIIFYSIILGIIGARVFYVIVNWEQYSENLIDIVKIYEGGIVFYGGAIAAIIFALLYMRLKKLPVLKVSDLLIPSLPLGHFFGRLGCYFYGCCYGKICEHGIRFPKWIIPGKNIPGAPAYVEHLNLGKISESANYSLPIYPTQLISAGYLLILMLILLVYDKKIKKNPGETFFLYLLLYGIFRFIIEFYRYYEPEFYVSSNITLSQIVSIILFIIGLIFFIKTRLKKNKN